jgi:Mg-chelatase subunit ChlD
MWYKWLFLFGLTLLTTLARAEEGDELRVIQARANLPSIQVWLDLPRGRAVKLSDFSATVGADAANVQSINSFEESGDGIGYIFLVDISQSMTAAQFAQIQHALTQWVNGMRSQDRAALITFGRNVATEVDFTADKNRLNQAILSLVAQDKETSLYRGLMEAINLGRRMDNDIPARRAIVMLTDGLDDTISGVTFDEVSKLNAEHRVPIYSIGFLTQPLNDKKRQGLKVLGQFARESGGNFVRASGDELDTAYQMQRQHIMQAYQMLLDCPKCEANGQNYRLNIIWSDSIRTISDGLDLRLLPKNAIGNNSSAASGNSAASNSGGNPAATTAAPAESGVHDYYPIVILVSVAITFCVVVIVMLRQRQVAPLDDIEQVLANVQSAPHNKSKSLAALDSALEQATASTARLTVLVGAQKGRVYLLPTHRRTIVGRAPNCDVQIVEDLEVSGQHAQIQYINKQLTLRDLNSTNGTEANGVPIHNDYPLQPGDILQMGRTELRFDWPDFKP